MRFALTPHLEIFMKRIAFALAALAVVGLAATRPVSRRARAAPTR
jgi:hypothetical protein